MEVGITKGWRLGEVHPFANVNEQPSALRTELGEQAWKPSKGVPEGVRSGIREYRPSTMAKGGAGPGYCGLERPVISRAISLA